MCFLSNTHHEIPICRLWTWCFNSSEFLLIFRWLQWSRRKRSANNINRYFVWIESDAASELGTVTSKSDFSGL
ncbi:30S ribosomal protein S7, chloroplastic [Dirofilaria immitis]